MSFYLNHLQPRVVLFLVVYNITVFAAVNVSIYDNDPAIIYSPQGAWSQSPPNALDFSGAHMLTQEPNATASFNFTGIAIYFLAPLWPYTVNTAISLDSGPVTLIDLVDHSRPSTSQGPETVQSKVVWNATGLANTQHNLRISVGAGQPYAIVDGLIYTNANATNVSSSSSLTPTSTLQDPILASSTAGVSPSPKSKSKSVVAITLGSFFGILGLLVIQGGVWYLCRRRKRPISEAWTVDGASYTPSMPVVGPNATNKNWSAEQLYHHGYSITQSGKLWHNPDYEHPVPPISSQPYYHGSRIPNRYVPGYALSTITERSTPQMGEGRTSLGNSPASHQSELEYHTAQGSEASYSVSRPQQQQQQQPLSSTGGIQRAPASTTQGYPSQRRKPVAY